MSKLWKESATLILLARNHNNVFKNGHNFKILGFTRSAKTSFMPSSLVFPGGAVDKYDESKEWLTHFKNFGITDNYFKQLTDIKGNRPPIFRNNNSEIAKEISLRITAIRETFEEIGVLLCRRKDEFPLKNIYGSYCENFDRLKWQEIVHNDPKRFLELCIMLNVVPDLWSLYEWSDWLTPAVFPRRYETAFFIVGLNTVPHIIPEPHEVDNFFWHTPNEFIQKQSKSEMWLAPPQFYEFNRLKTAPSLDILIQFSKERNSKGLDLMHPIHYTCTDGLVGTLPGDDFYKKDEYSHEASETNQTLEEFRKKAKNLHRAEIRGTHQMHTFVNIKLKYDCLSPTPQLLKL